MNPYSWINKPVLDVLEYFSGTLGYFMNVAVSIGRFVSILAIIWNCIQLAFSTLEVRKFIVGTIMKFLFFILALSFYPIITSSVKTLATKLGTEASGNPVALMTQSLAGFKTQLELAIKPDLEKISEQETELAAAIAMKDSIIQDRQSSQTPGGWDKKDPLVEASKKAAQAEAMIEERKKNIQGNLNTIAAITTVLKPVSADGDRIDGSLTQSYVLDITLRDSKGNDTGYLSPNAILRISLLGAQIMWEKEWTSITGEWSENSKGILFNREGQKLKILDFPFRRVWDIALVFISMIAIVLATVFALCQYVMNIVEFTIIISVSILFVPCLLFDGFKDLAAKVIPAILGQAVKMMVITMCMFASSYMFMGLAMDTIGEGTGFNLTTFAYVAFTVVIAFVLTQNAPKVAMTLLTGQPQLSMGELVQAMGTAAALGAGGARLLHGGGQLSAAALAASGRGLVNRLGDVQAMVAAGSVYNEYAKGHGASDGQATWAGIKGAGGELLSRTGKRFSSSLHGAAHYGVGGAGGLGGHGGGGGSAGGGWNRFSSGAAANMDKQQLKATMTDDISYKKQNMADDLTGQVSNMSYGHARNEHGQSATVSEFMKQQGDSARLRAESNLSDRPPRYYAKEAGIKAESSYTGNALSAPPSDYLPPPPAYDKPRLPPSDTIYL